MNQGVEIQEFHEIVQELLQIELVQSLDQFTQHCQTSRLAHSMNVAYYSYVVCKRLQLDYRAATRAGLLHDLFLYDWRSEKQPEGAHAFAHPKIALRNAQSIVELTPIEEDAILNHMWPVTPKTPKYKESFVVSFADKYSACIEIAASSMDKTKAKWVFMKNVCFGGVLAK